MIGTGATRVSLGGQNKFNALCKIHDLQLGLSDAGQVKICFDIGTTSSIGVVDVNTTIRKMTFC